MSWDTVSTISWNRTVRTLVTGQLAEAWAILRRHPHGPELPQHSVTPCLLRVGSHLI